MRRALLGLAALLALAAPAAVRAESEREAGTAALDLELRLRPDGFRVGGTLTGPAGPYGARLDGRIHRDGVRLEGRLEEPGRAVDFRLDAEVRPRRPSI
ncbi:MAG TPA: hypothetical protein VNK50_14240 [Calidithermus sp.]|jgi:hypothetical protein|nr:hypothetical protein [Calidithermus sp.]